MNIYKRDYFKKKNIDSFIIFNQNPLKDLLRWNIFFIQHIFFYFSPKIYILIRNYYLKKNSSYARDRTNNVKNYYAKTSRPFYELQIKNTTRVCNIFNEDEVICYELNGQKDNFIFGISPLIEYYNAKCIIKWSIKVQIKQFGETLETFDIEIPFLSHRSEKNNNFYYKDSDGWIDLNIDLSKYNKNPLTIAISTNIQSTKSRQFKEKLSISNPTFISKKRDFKNIIYLSLESLSDFKLISDKYGINGFENIDKLIDISAEYKNAYSVVDSTFTYSATVMSGLMPSQHGIGDYSISADSFKNYTLNNSLSFLTEKLKKNKFLNFFTATATRFSSKSGTSRGFDDYYNVYNNYDVEHPEIEWVINKLDSYSGFDKFLFCHLDYLHNPFFSFNYKKKQSLYNINNLNKNKGLNSIAIEGYRAGLKRFDKDIGILLKHLEDKSELDKSLIILTGDHGDSIQWKKGSDYTLYDERVRVPLIVKFPKWFIGDNKDLNNEISSNFKIHEILNKSLGLETSKELLRLPQYIEKYKDFIFSESIMVPNHQWDNHCLSTIYKNFKYVCFNKIDWVACKITNRLNEKLYKRDDITGLFNEDKDVSAKFIDDLEYLRNVSYNVIKTNLSFLKKFPPQKY
jgi:hypothetical protein